MSVLNPPTLFRLDLASKPIVEAFGPHVYLVGSVQERTAHALSDFDVRLILSDKKYDKLIRSPEQRTMLDLALGAFLRELTGLPVDFQIQRHTQAIAKFGDKPRNPLCRRKLTSWIGDSV